MNIIDFEYKRKFDVDIWKQDKRQRHRQQELRYIKVERALGKKTGFEWNENDFLLLYNWLQYFYYYFSCNDCFCCENLCEIVCRSSVDGGSENFAVENTRTPLAMHAKRRIRRMSQNIVA